jgi:hypothetical protein
LRGLFVLSSNSFEKLREALIVHCEGFGIFSEYGEYALNFVPEPV